MTCWLKIKNKKTLITLTLTISEAYIVFSTSTRSTPVLTNNYTVFQSYIMSEYEWSIVSPYIKHKKVGNQTEIHSCSSVIVKSEVIFIFTPPPLSYLKRGLQMLNIYPFLSWTLQHCNTKFGLFLLLWLPIFCSANCIPRYTLTVTVLNWVGSM